jgi:membrane protein
MRMARSSFFRRWTASVWRPCGLSLREFVARVWEVANEADVANRASELAYSFLLAVFPLLLFSVTLFGLFASEQTILRNTLLRDVGRMLPPGTYELVVTTLDEIIRNAGGGKLTLGFLLTLIPGSGGVAQMITTMNAAYGLPERRSWLQVRVIAILLTVAISVLLVVVLLVGVGGGRLAWVAVHERGADPSLETAWRLVGWILGIGFVGLTLDLIDYFGPDRDDPQWKWLTPGSAVSIVLWLAASAGLRLYVHYFGNFSRAYGSLGAAIVLLLWFYVIGLSALIGGVINSVILRAKAQNAGLQSKRGAGA